MKESENKMKQGRLGKLKRENVTATFVIQCEVKKYAKNLEIWFMHPQKQYVLLSWHFQKCIKGPDYRHSC